MAALRNWRGVRRGQRMCTTTTPPACQTPSRASRLPSLPPPPLTLPLHYFLVKLDLPVSRLILKIMESVLYKETLISRQTSEQQMRAEQCGSRGRGTGGNMTESDFPE